jgi:4-methylaminobutanoate oxidase (formaldehyde-forming)
LCTFVLAGTAYPVGGEAILCGGDVVGFTTSANHGHTVGAPIAYGYIPVEVADREEFEVEVYGDPIPARRHRGALYDPKTERLKA